VFSRLIKSGIICHVGRVAQSI